MFLNLHHNYCAAQVAKTSTGDLSTRMDKFTWEACAKTTRREWCMGCPALSCQALLASDIFGAHLRRMKTGDDTH
jgi:hypothetical protein